MSIFLLGATFSTTLLADTSWELIKESDDVRLFRNKREDSPLHEFKAQTVIRVPLSSILAVFTDTAHAKEWMYGVVEQKVVTGNIPADLGSQEYSVDLYNRIHIGNGFEDRDVLVKIQLKADLFNKQIWVRFDSIKHPLTDGVVRIPFMHGHWLFRPIQGGLETFVEYQLHSSAGLWLPNWIVNMVAKNVPLQTLVELKKQVRRRTYPGFEHAISQSEAYQSIIKP